MSIHPSRSFFIHMNTSQQNKGELQLTSSDLLCYICQDFYCRPHTAACGHTFCFLCIDEYLLFSDVCPHCMKPIRGKPLHPVPCLAEFIDNLNKNDKEQRLSIKKRNEKAKEYVRNRELRGIKVGMLLDIRDSNNIWCEGMVVRIITRQQEPLRLLRVTYINYLQKKEQDVPIDSERLASKGFFTSRKDIPHYGIKTVSPLISSYQF